MRAYYPCGARTSDGAQRDPPAQGLHEGRQGVCQGRRHIQAQPGQDLPPSSRFLADCWTKHLPQFLAPWAFCKVPPYVSWLYMREQVEGKRQRGQDGRHGHLQTNLRRNTPSPLLYSPGEKRVTRSRPHSRGGRHTGRESPGTRPGATPLPSVYRSVLEVR